jgi:hypothetical protein
MMKIEFMADGGESTPAIVIYGRNWEACQSLEEGFQHLATGKVKQVAVHLIPGFDVEKGLTLTARAGGADTGVTTSGERSFDCTLTVQAWDKAAKALQPFCRPLPENDDALATLDRSGKIALVIGTERL